MTQAAWQKPPSRLQESKKQADFQTRGVSKAITDVRFQPRIGPQFTTQFLLSYLEKQRINTEFKDLGNK